MSRIWTIRIAFALAALGLPLASWPVPDQAPTASAQQKADEKGKEEVGKGPGGLPVTGKPVKALAPLDVGVEKIMLRHGIPGAAVAVTRHGKLIFARGYGWAYYEKNILATPETLFGLASVSKVFTAQAILSLVDEGKLKLDQKAFEIIGHLKPLPRSVMDRRLSQITIRQLLNHSAGWDRDKSGDPINWSQQVALRMGVRMPINEDQLIRFMLGMPLDFDPGSRTVYSNLGYIVLGQIVAKVSGQPYERYVKTKVFEPMGVKHANLHGRDGRYFDREARRYNPGLMHAMPAYNSPWTDASGGWSASVVDLARLMTAIDGSRTGKTFLSKETTKEMLAAPPRPLEIRKDKTHFGLGWDTVQEFPKDHGYLKGGCWPGVRATVKHRADGINTVILYNAVVQMDQLDLRIANDALKEIQEHIADIKEWPNEDLFEKYR